jgi:uncharacterized membrane protein YkvI
MAVSTFQRTFLPGFAFKGVTIGGGYATGRELAEFFLPTGPWGGIFGMLLAMLLWSAIAFFVAMLAFYPSIQGLELPLDFLLSRLHAPTFRVIFQFMIFAALLESGTGAVHAVNERVVNLLHNHGRSLSSSARCALSLGLLVTAIFIARRFGLISLIGRGYRALSFAFLAIYVAPLVTFGVWQLLRRRYDAKTAANPACADQ